MFNEERPITQPGLQSTQDKHPRHVSGSRPWVQRPVCLWSFAETDIPHNVNTSSLGAVGYTIDMTGLYPTGTMTPCIRPPVVRNGQRKTKRPASRRSKGAGFSFSLPTKFPRSARQVMQLTSRSDQTPGLHARRSSHRVWATSASNGVNIACTRPSESSHARGLAMVATPVTTIGVWLASTHLALCRLHKTRFFFVFSSFVVVANIICDERSGQQCPRRRA